MIFTTRATLVSFLFVTVIGISATQDIYAQFSILEERVTIAFTNSTVKEALEKISHQTGYVFSYSNFEAVKRAKVTDQFVDIQLKNIIRKIWAPKRIKLSAVGRTIEIVAINEVENAKGNLSGQITDEDNHPLPGVTVRLLGTSMGNITDQSGKVNLEGIPSGDRTIEVSFVGYETAQIQLKVDPGGSTSFSKQLKVSTNMLNEILVEGASLADEIASEPIKINTIDAKAFEIQSVGAAEMLKIVPGVLVRRTGGLGSRANVNLNGLGGNAVRIYVDGFPVEYLGGGYNLNNLPGSVIDRLEVYKGVVPTDKSTDALGGAVNIVSKRLYDDTLELSYQVGSFNTHRASFLGSKKINNHFSVTLEGYHNYSDNDFLMGNVRNIVIDSIPDRFGNGLIPAFRDETLSRVRRFHNAHRSSFVQAGLHWNDLSWADQLSFTSNFSNRFDEVQTLNITQGFALLGRTGEATAFNQSLAYVKRFFNEQLELRYRGVISSSVNSVRNNNPDRFNWNRELIERNVTDSLNTDTEGLNHAHRLGLIYRISDKHTLSINNFYARTRFFRKDNIDPFVEIDGQLINQNEIPSFFTKNIASLEWRGDWFNKKLTSVVFGKQYFYHVETAIPFSGVRELELEDKSTGYGGALKYLFTPHFFVRGSYEYAVRIPTEAEVYGDFVNIVSNFELRPERSNNINLGITFEANFEQLFRINTSLDGFIRDTKNLIWLTPFGSFQRFTNNREVKSLGVEWSLKVTRDDYSNIEFNLTAQERTYQAFNGDGFRFQDPSFIGSRFPNTPLFFHNLQLNLGIKSLKNTLPNVVLYGSWFHIGEFSITDEVRNAEPEPFSLVPTQNEFNLGIGYFSSNDKLSLSFQVNNLTNDLELFDNWRVPKPNRNFQFKV
ncbi:MAG: TonB-dependent receptor, partial [Bacteroidota bacterium]